MAYPNIDPTTIFQDAFTEASSDTELSSHTPDTGTGWSLIFRDNSADKINAVAASDSAKPNASQANRGVIYSADGTYPSADYEASVKIVAGFTGSNRGYLIVRMTDQENMYALRFTTGATATRMYKKVAGMWTALGSFKTDPAVGDTVKIRVCGNVLQYFYNDVLIDQQTDSALTSAGKAGLGMGGGAELAASTDDLLNTSELDDFLVQTVERTHTFFSTSVTSMPVNLPGGIQAGDLLIAIVEDRNAPSYTKPTGWSDLFTQAGGGSVGQLRGFYKIADGTESGQVTFTAGATTTAIWVSFRIKNFHGTQAPEAATASGDSTNADSPSLSPSWGSEPTLFLSIAGHAAASAAAFSAGPSGYSDFLCKGASSGGSAVSIASADKKVTAASENPGNFTASGSNRWWAAATIAIRTLNTTPTISPDTADGYDFGTDTTPTLEFTGTDDETNDLRYEVQIDIDNTFDSQSGSPLLDKVSGTDSGFANTVTGGDTDPFNSGEKVSFTVQAGDALPSGTFYWRTRTKDPSGKNQWSGWTATRSFTVSAGTATNDARSARITGRYTANGSRSARITGKDTSNDNRGGRISGRDSANASRGARITGTATGNDTRSARITGHDTANSNRGARLTGTDSANASRSSRITGTDSASDTRGGRTTGANGANDNRGARITGTATDNSSRSARVAGKLSDSSDRGGRVTGKDSATDTRTGRIAGRAQGVDTRGARVSGRDTANASRGGRITGNANVSDARGGRVMGTATASNERGARISGKNSLQESRGGRITGTDGATSTREARVSGRATAEDTRSGRVAGKDTQADAREARITGSITETDQREARVSGQDVGFDTIGARVAGKDTAEDFRGARITGFIFETVSSIRGAVIEGVRRNPYTKKPTAYSDTAAPYEKTTQPYSNTGEKYQGTVSPYTGW